MKKYSWTCIAVAICVTATALPAQADIIISFSPSDSVVEVGDVFTVDILADIPLAEATVGFGFDALFDTGILAHDPLFDVVIGPSFTTLPPSPFEDGDKLAGILPFGFPPPPAVFGTDVLLATMTFEALTPGMTDLIGGITAGDFLEGFVLPGGGFAGVSFLDGSVTVIPAPGAAVLALIGMPFIGWARRRIHPSRS